MDATSRMAAFGLMVLILTGCGGETAEEVADSAAVETAAATNAAAAESDERGADEAKCPSFGALTQTWDASGTPIVFDFTYPEGFEIRKSTMVGDSMYQLDLTKQVRFAGANRQVSISLIQQLKPKDDRIPTEVALMRQHADNPAMKAMQEMAPTEAGEISFRGETIPLFRITTDSKVVYKFNLPAEGGYRGVDVHFMATAIGSMCIDRLNELAEAWVRTLEPAA